jgi:CBS domain-containing membrane protein
VDGEEGKPMPNVASRTRAPLPRRPLPRTVRDLMTEDVRTLGPLDSLADAADLMDSLHIRHVPIVEDGGEIVGLVTERDLSKTAFSVRESLPVSLQEDLLHRRRVREIMTEEVETVEPDEDLKVAAEMLLENKIGCLPVTEGLRLVGIVTEADFVRDYLERS